MNKQIVVVSLIALALCGIIGQVVNATFVRVSGTQAATNEDYLEGVTTDGQDVFYGSAVNPTKLVKFTGDTNTRAGALTLTGLDNFWNGITYYNGNIFIGDTASNPAKIAKVATSTLTTVGSVLTLGTNEYDVYALANDGSTFLYAAIRGSSGFIVKVKMSDLTRVSAITLANSVSPARLAIDAKYLYATSDDGTDTNKQLTRVILSTFLEDTALVFSAGERSSWAVLADAPASTSTFVYVGLQTNPGIIVKVSVSTWARVSAKTVTAADDIYDMVFDTLHNNIYAVNDNSPTTIVQLKVSDLSTVTTLIANLDEDEGYMLARVGDYSLFFGTDTQPGRSVKFAIDGPPVQAPNTTAAPLSVGATESKIVAALVALISVVFVMA